MNQISTSNKIKAYKFEIDDGCGFQYIEGDFHMHGDDKPQYVTFLDLHSKLNVTPPHLIGKKLGAQRKELIAQGHRASK